MTTTVVEKDFFQEKFEPTMLDIFKTESGVPYISVEGRTIRIVSSEFKEWLWKQHFMAFGHAPTCCKVNQTIKTLYMFGKTLAPVKEVHSRIAQSVDATYIDLGNDESGAIQITGEGVREIENPPVKFIRPQAQCSIGRPNLDGKPEDLHLLRKYIPFKTSSDFVLFVSWLLGCLNTFGGYPLLFLLGEQGSAKSTTSTLIKDLMDRSTVLLMNLPKSLKELMIAAANHFILIFDNISKMRDDQSDNLCKVSTGAGITMRALYTTQGMAQIKSKNPCVINSINYVPTRQDLLDRSLLVNLNHIKPEDRKTMKELLESWEHDRPLILGALCHAASAAHRNYHLVTRKDLPRMADFAKWVIAAEDELPWENGLFMDTLRNHRSTIVDEAVDADSVALGIIRLMENTASWSGPASKLLEVLAELINQSKYKYPDFPKIPNQLSRNLNRISAFLREKGILVEKRHSGQRWITITNPGIENKVKAESPADPPQSPLEMASQSGIELVQETFGAVRKSADIAPEESQEAAEPAMPLMASADNITDF